MTGTKKVKSAGRFRTSGGIKVRARLRAVEEKQRKKQTCPFCKKKALKRIAKGLWQCKKCGKRFASHAYYIESVV